MNRHLMLSLRFLSYWHVGAGYGAGARCDDLMRKDRDGLPLMPGRTLHGHLRDATQTLEDMGWVDAGTTDELFGETAESLSRRLDRNSSRTALPNPGPDGANECAPGRLVVDNGFLPCEEAAWLREHAAERTRLYRIMRNTALTDAGVADENTLRAVEVCVPLTLHAPVRLLDDKNSAGDLKVVRTACRLIRRIGMGRHRGLGRCMVEFAETDAGATAPVTGGAGLATTMMEDGT